MEEFASALDESFPGPLDRWEHFKKAVYSTARSIFGRKTNKTAEWLESHSDEMTPVIVEKRKALAAYKACPRKRNLRAHEPLTAKFGRLPGDVQKTTGFSTTLRCGQ